MTRAGSTLLPTAQGAAPPGTWGRKALCTGVNYPTLGLFAQGSMRSYCWGYQMTQWKAMGPVG